MAITAGLATKILIGLGIVGLGATGAYYLKGFGANLISEYDEALLEFLDGDKDHDIVFDVKKGEDAKDDLTEADIVLPNGEKKDVSVSAIVQISTASTSAFKKKGGTAADENDKGMKKIRELNGGN